MGVIVGYLLLIMEEEDAFWTMVAIMEDLMPATYYTTHIPGLLNLKNPTRYCSATVQYSLFRLGVMADVRVIRSLLVKYVPKVHEVLAKGDVDITVILVSWLLPAYGNVVHVKLLLRIWDLFFFHGSIVLIKVSFGILKMAGKSFTGSEKIRGVENKPSPFILIRFTLIRPGKKKEGKKRIIVPYKTKFLALFKKMVRELRNYRYVISNTISYTRIVAEFKHRIGT